MSKNEFDALLLKKLQEEAFEYNPDSWQQLAERLDSAITVPNEITSFDTLLAAKMQEESFDYNPASWNQLVQKLDSKNPEQQPKATPFPFRKWGIAIGSAAAIFIIAGLLTTFNNSGNDTETMDQPPVAKTTGTKPSLPETPATQTQTIIGAQTPATPSQSFSHSSHVIRNSNDAMQDDRAVQNPLTQQKAQEPVLILPQDNKVEAAHHPEAPVVVQAPVPNETNNAHKEITAPPAAQKERASDYIAQNLPDRSWLSTNDLASPVRSKPKMNIAFAGGVNYGNINTGYTAGISLKHKIGSDFFVDGTIAMMYNNNANNVAANNGPSVAPPSGTASKPGQSSTMNSFATPALDPIQKLYYVQMNPSFGYQIEDKVALSVGGDFQKMLNKKDEIVQPDNNNTKIFPTMDIGITTRSEFTISPNLQAGLMYREGLNNIFKSDAPFVNRRYLQVQFKYNIPLK